MTTKNRSKFSLNAVAQLTCTSQSTYPVNYKMVEIISVFTKTGDRRFTLACISFSTIKHHLLLPNIQVSTSTDYSLR